MEDPSASASTGHTQDLERLGVFFLGRRCDPATGQVTPEAVFYDSKDLTTHAVCVGMTGSGKTGLCLSLLEEAAIDGIPAIVIDPKGDLGNLLLTFPGLSAEDFRPWIDEDEARRKGTTADEFAALEAARWKAGLAEWGQSGDRIGRLRQAADLAIYTPGSTSGLSIAVLASLAPPEKVILDDPELLANEIQAVAGSLLGLAGVSSDPVRGREHILLARILEDAWKAGHALDLAALVAKVLNPPFQQIGVLGLESFFPASARFELAMALKNLLASPGFAAWREGEQLDIGRLLYTAQGQPRIAVFSIAHLGDQERMFFVTLLFQRLLGWMRNQPGTSSLRALVYMDEVFGYLPPVANPPSKLPILTMLKQARAFGVGLILATQNPVDLDYKGLSNAGTWMIGRLQTERDRDRLLAGLEMISAEQVSGDQTVALDRQELARWLTSLKQRQFLLHNVHRPPPLVLAVRWAMSYLRGPLTRAEISRLMRDRRAAAGTTDGAESQVQPSAIDGQRPGAAPTGAPHTGPLSSVRPVVEPGVHEFFLPPILEGPLEAREVVYHPLLVGLATVHFLKPAYKVDRERAVAYISAIPAPPQGIAWQPWRDGNLDEHMLHSAPAAGALFAPLPPIAARSSAYARWERAFVDRVFRQESLMLYKSAALKRISRPGQSEMEFRLAMRQLDRESRDEIVEKIRRKYARRLQTASDRVRRAQEDVVRQQQQASDQRTDALISLGSTILSTVFGRKSRARSSLGRATTAARGIRKSRKESLDIDQARQILAARLEEQQSLEAEIESEVRAVRDKLDAITGPLEKVHVLPKRSDVVVRLVALVWQPRRASSAASAASLPDASA